jgi:hypothetical protein
MLHTLLSGLDERRATLMDSEKCDGNCIECEDEFRCKKHLDEMGMGELLPEEEKWKNSATTTTGWMRT